MPSLNEIAKKDVKRQRAEGVEQDEARLRAWQEYPALAARFVEATLALDQGAVDPTDFDELTERENPAWHYEREGYAFTVLSDGVFGGQPQFSLWLMVAGESVRPIRRPADLIE